MTCETADDFPVVELGKLGGGGKGADDPGEFRGRVSERRLGYLPPVEWCVAAEGPGGRDASKAGQIQLAQPCECLCFVGGASLGAQALSSHDRPPADSS